MPRHEDFTKLFCEQAGHIVKAAEELRRLVRGDEAVEAHVRTINGIEMAADRVARSIFETANRTFNAPIDIVPGSHSIALAAVFRPSEVFRQKAILPGSHPGSAAALCRVDVICSAHAILSPPRSCIPEKYCASASVTQAGGESCSPGQSK
jgi:hypothetical protein